MCHHSRRYRQRYRRTEFCIVSDGFSHIRNRSAVTLVYYVKKFLIRFKISLMNHTKYPCTGTILRSLHVFLFFLFFFFWGGGGGGGGWCSQLGLLESSM